MQYFPFVVDFPKNDRFKSLAMYFPVSFVNRGADFRIYDHPGEFALDIDDWIAEVEFKLERISFWFDMVLNKALQTNVLTT